MDPASLVAGPAAEGASEGTTDAVTTDATPIDAQQVLANMENSLLAGDVSQQTHDTISSNWKIRKSASGDWMIQSVRQTWPRLRD